jgi:hypothetical protein
MEMMEPLFLLFFLATPVTFPSKVMMIHFISHVRLSRSKGEDPSIDVHNKVTEPSSGMFGCR